MRIRRETVFGLWNETRLESKTESSRRVCFRKSWKWAYKQKTSGYYSGGRVDDDDYDDDPRRIEYIESVFFFFFCILFRAAQRNWL